MESCVIGAVYLNYDEICKRQINDYDHLLQEIKILLLSPNNVRPYFQLPMIRMFTKSDKIESLKEGIRKTLGIKSKASLKMTEIRVSIDKAKHISRSLLIMVFLNTKGYEERIDKSEFITLSHLSTVPIGEQSMDYITAVKKWIIRESIDGLTELMEWFKPYKRGDHIPFKSKEIVVQRSQKRDPDYIYKSTSLETIARPDSATNVGHSRPQADSLDRISDKEMSGPAIDIRRAFKSRAARQKLVVTGGGSGPVSAGPIQDSDQVISNPLINCQYNEYCGHSDVVVYNPYWKQPPLDLSLLSASAKSLYDRNHSVYRSRPWSLDYPLHCAVYMGDLHLIRSLLEKGCSCVERDRAGWTPLHYAVWYGHLDIVALLLKSQLVSVNSVTDDSFTGLHLSLVSKQSAITEMLLHQPDIDISTKNCLGEDARMLAEKYDKQFMMTLTKMVPPKLSKIQVTLTDRSTRLLVLCHGLETTFQQLRVQMIDMMNMPASCSDVFSFWIGFRTPKFTGKNCLIPSECFGPMSTSLKDLDVSDWKLYWRRNVFLGLEKERKVKHPLVLSLLFEEAVDNYTCKSHYPCDDKDLCLLSSVLLYRHLPETMVPNNHHQQASDNIGDNRRALSLSRVNRPLSSFVLGSKLTGQIRQMSASMQTLKDRSKHNQSHSSFNELTDRAPIIDHRSRQAKTFLSSSKNLALILPKKKLKNSKVNWSEEIIKRFVQSPLSYRNYSSQEREYRFLSLCWNLTLYGCAYFRVEIKLNISIPFSECILAVNDMGVYFLHAHTKNLIQNFKYSTITWHPNAADKCMLLFTKRNNIYIKTRHSMMISDLMLRLHSINLQ